MEWQSKKNRKALGMNQKIGTFHPENHTSILEGLAVLFVKSMLFYLQYNLVC
jgi:hypothetical protein